MPSISEASRRVLSLLKELGPNTAVSLGDALGTTAEAARQRLVALGEAGLVSSASRRGGVGRPQQVWALTQAGHGLFPDRHAEVTAQLIDTIRQEFGEDGVERMIAAHEAKARARYAAAMPESTDLSERLDHLTAIRSHEGYMAEWYATDDGYVLAENHCPICAAASACQGFCRVEQALFQEMLGPGVAVERFDHILDGARRCAYRITLDKQTRPKQPAQAG